MSIRIEKGKLAIFVVMVFMLVFVYTQTCSADGTSGNQVDPKGSAANRSLYVTGSADVMVNPDQVVFTLAVETNNMNIMKAKSENDDSINKIKGIAKEYNIDTKYVKTDYINVSPKYTYKANGENLFNGYEIHRGMVITLKDLSKFDEFLTRILGAGANYVQNVQFVTTELRKYKDQARALAIKAAKEKAEALSKELGQTVGKASMIQEVQEDSYSYYSPWSSSAFSAANVISNTVVNAPMTSSQNVNGDDYSPGQIKVSSRVTVTFDLN